METDLTGRHQRVLEDLASQGVVGVGFRRRNSDSPMGPSGAIGWALGKGQLRSLVSFVLWGLRRHGVIFRAVRRL